MATAKATRKKSVLTRKDAVVAAKKARKHYERTPNKDHAWEKGGKKWSRVLGHFGLTP
jgi:hypothetical protein